MPGHKHIVNDPATLVLDSLRGLVQLNPSVKLDEQQRVVYRPQAESEPHVALLSGGGSGHEPAHAGFVGEGLLDAAVCGSIFASPSVAQIRKGIELVIGASGALLVVKNYTGDALHFGLAAEQHKSAGLVGDVRVLMVGDDVAVGRQQGTIVGRRGLAGVLLVYKILAALSKTGAALDAVEELGKYLVTRLATLGVGLDHCHVPGTRKGEATLDDTELEIGMGIHNEPGALKQTIGSASQLVNDMLSRLTDTTDGDRSFVPFSGSGDEVVLMVNNLGSISELEMGLIVDQALTWLSSRGYKVRRVLSGTYITSLDMPGFSLTLLLLPKTGEQYSKETILQYLDAEVEAPGWKWTSRKEPGVLQSSDASGVQQRHTVKEVDLAPEDGKAFLAAVTRACKALVEAEPELTMQDQIAGDGDAGLTLKAGAEHVLAAIKNGEIKGVNVLEDVGLIAECVEESMGGTSGALYSIFFAGLRTALRSTGASTTSSKVWARAAQGALETLYKYTRARPPSRTLVDPLEAFITSLASKSLSKAAEDALAAADKTKELVAKAGRGAYVNQNDLKERQVPDPGAWGIWRIVDGLRGYEAK